MKRVALHALAAIAEFERDLIRERVIAGVQGPRRRAATSGAPHYGPASPEEL